MKIAINKKHGGFTLSDEAMYLLAEKMNVKIEKRGEFFVAVSDELAPTPFHEGDFDRSNPRLISVIEELGDRANTEWSKLAIVEIPDDVDWYIDEYDGWESIHEVHRSWE